MNAFSPDLQTFALGTTQPLAAVLYRSTATIPAEALHASGAVEEFAARNLEAGLTGHLHLEEGVFYQYLEGPARALAAAWAAIRRDRRHEDILQLSQAPIAVRRFPRWSMGYSDGAQRSLYDWAARSGLSLKGRHAAPGVAAFMEYASSPAAR